MDGIQIYNLQKTSQIVMDKPMSDKMQAVYERWKKREELPLLMRKHASSISSMVSDQPSSKPYQRKRPYSQESHIPLYEPVQSLSSSPYPPS